MRHLPSALVFVLLALAIAPAAQAQTGACSVSMDAAVEGSGAFDAGDVRQVTLTVTNDGQLDQRIEVTVARPAPGWFWDDSRRVATLAAGASIDFDVAIRYGGSDDAALDADLGPNVVATCDGGAVLGSQTTATDDAEVGFTGIAPPPPPEPEQPLWPWVLAGVVVLGVVGFGAKGLLDRRPPRVRAWTDEADRKVTPGRGTSFPLLVENQGARAMNVRLQVKGLPEGWSGMLALPEVVLGPKEKRSLWVMVKAPEGVNPGEQAEFTVACVPEEGTERAVEFTATVSDVA